MWKRSEYGMALAALALAGLAALSCNKLGDIGGSSSPSSDNGGVTTTDPGTGATPTPSDVPGVPNDVVPVPTSTNTMPMMAAPPETPAALPSPAVLEAVNTATTKLNGITTGVEGTSVRFVDCTDTAACTTRLEAKSLTGLRDLLQAVSAQQGGIDFTAREQLDAYTGQSFVADVTLGAAATRPVPTDESELLGN